MRRDRASEARSFEFGVESVEFEEFSSCNAIRKHDWKDIWPAMPVLYRYDTGVCWGRARGYIWRCGAGLIYYFGILYGLGSCVWRCGGQLKF